MNIAERVKFALIGFIGLFEGATEYSFDNVIVKAVEYALEEEGFTSAVTNTVVLDMIVCRACINALGPIESIILLMPTRRRMEIGVETENVDVKKSIAALKSSYEKRYEKLSLKDVDVQTYIIKNGNPSDEPLLLTLEDILAVS